MLAIHAFVAPQAAFADGISPVRAKVEAGKDGYRLDAEFDIRFSPGLEEAVNRGVALYFVVEFELSKPRWYWFDEKPVQLSQHLQDHLHAAASPVPAVLGERPTRTSPASRTSWARSSRVRGWPVADAGALRRQGDYQAAIRMRLDTTQLPKPFQLNAVASSDWNLASDWYRWTVNP